MLRKSLRDFFWSAFTKVSPRKATEFRCNRNVGYKVDLDNPKTLNEKIQWLKLNTYYKNPLVTQCSDKYLVRDYVRERVGDEILVELYGVYDSPEDIDWDKLPKEFVLKCNHGSGGNIICHDKDTLDKELAKEKLARWLKEDYGPPRVEFAYDDIDRKIICEKFIETDDGLPPKDYKIFCSYGKPKFLFVASDRVDNNTKFDFFTIDWKWLPVKNCHENAGPSLKKPEKFDKMLEYASLLSKDFPIVRVDFYYENGKIIFGELTFLHFGGVRPFDPVEYDRFFGDMLPIDEEIKKYS